MRTPFRIGTLAIVATCVQGPHPTMADEPPARAAVTFEQDVKSIFRKHCVNCHNAERPRGELDLSQYAGVMTGGTSGKAAIAGKPDESPVYMLPSHLDDPKMPPNKPKIPQRELDLIRDWISGGLIEKSGSKSVAAAPSAPAGLTTPNALARATPVTALAVSPTAPLAAVAGRRQVLLFDVTDAKLLGAVAFPEGEVHVLKFSGDGKTLIAAGGVGGASGKVVGFAVDGWRRTFEVGDELDAVIAADLSPDGTKVALGGPSRQVKVYVLAGGRLLYTFRRPTDWVTAVAFSPDGLLVAAGDRFGGLFAWETASGADFATLRGHTKAVTALAWRKDGDVLASSSEDGTVRLWDMHKATESARVDAHPGGSLSLDWDQSGALISGGRDQLVHVWAADGLKPIGRVGPAEDFIMRAAVTSGRKSVLTGDWSGQVRHWPLDGQSATTLPLPIAPPKFVATVEPDMTRKAASVKPVLAATRQAEMATAKADAERAAAELHDAEAALTALKKVVAARAEALRKAEGKVKDLEAGRGGSK